MEQKKKRKQIIFYSIIIILLGFFCLLNNVVNPLIYKLLLNQFNIVSKNDSLIVHYISVGQGDAISINLPDGKCMLIDTGTIYSNGNYINYIKEKVLASDKDKVIDYLVLSHGDSDHVGGSLRLYKNFKIDTIFLPKVESENDIYKEFISVVVQNGSKIIQSSEFSEIKNAGYKINFYVSDISLSSNEASTVVKLDYMEKTFLFAGDISKEVEDELANKYGEELDCDVLKVAHHGSKYSSSSEFLRIVTPRISIISCGVNSYGHPTSEAISNLEMSGSSVYRTDKHGTIVLVVGDNYNLNLLTGQIIFTPLNLDYRYIILAVQLLIFVKLIIMIIKKKI